MNRTLTTLLASLLVALLALAGAQQQEGQTQAAQDPMAAQQMAAVRIAHLFHDGPEVDIVIREPGAQQQAGQQQEGQQQEGQQAGQQEGQQAGQEVEQEDQQQEHDGVYNVDGVGAGSVSGYMMVPAGQYEIEIWEAGTRQQQQGQQQEGQQAAQQEGQQEGQQAGQQEGQQQEGEQEGQEAGQQQNGDGPLQTLSFNLEAGQYYTILVSATEAAIEEDEDAEMEEETAEQAQEADAAAAQDTAVGEAEEGEGGTLTIRVQPQDATVNVTGPDDFTQEFNGSQTLTGLQPGDYVVAVTHDGHEPQEQTVTVGEDAGETVEITLEMTDAAATEAAEAEAAAMEEEEDDLRDQIQVGIINDDLQIPPAGLALVRFIHLAPGVDTVDLYGETEEQRETRDQAEEQARQAMLDAQEQAGTGILVIEVQPANASVAVTGPDDYLEQFNGSQTLSDLQPGTYIVTVTHDGYEPAEDSADVEVGEETTVEIRLQQEADDEDTEGADADAAVGALTDDEDAEHDDEVTEPIPGTPLVPNLAFMTASEYAEVQPGTYHLQARTADDEIVLDVDGSRIEPGVVYTFYVYGHDADDVQVTVSVDALVAIDMDGMNGNGQNGQQEGQTGAGAGN